MIFSSNASEEQFYSAAIKTRIQLLWMQNVAMRIALWLVLVINLVAPTLFLVALLIVNERTQLIPRTDSSIVIASVFFPFVLCYAAAVYAAGLLIYRWRVRRAARRRATIVPMYEMSLDPVETAALIGSADYRAETWHLINRLIQTENIKLRKRDDGVVVLERVANDDTLAALKWYERQLLDDIFVSDQQQQERLLRSMSPERLAALDGVRYGADIPLDTLHDHVGAYHLSHLNQLIRTQLIREGLFQRLPVIGMWFHTFLYITMWTTPIFAVILTHAMRVTVPWHDTALQMSVPMVTGVVVAYVAVFMVCMIWFLNTDIYTRFGLGKYVEAEGLRLYLGVALKDRLRSGDLAEREMAYFLPYAQVMGIVKVDDQERVSRLLALRKYWIDN